jgi:hypothetical protein
MTVKEFEAASKQVDRCFRRACFRFTAYMVVLLGLHFTFMAHRDISLYLLSAFVAFVAVTYFAMLYTLRTVPKRKAREYGLICEKCGDNLVGNESVKLCGVCPKCEHQLLDDAPYVRRKDPATA